jgi:hypothetical protein
MRLRQQRRDKLSKNQVIPKLYKDIYKCTKRFVKEG